MFQPLSASNFMEIKVMVNVYKLNEPQITLKSSLAGEFVTYIYLSSDKKLLYYSNYITDLLGFKEVVKPLSISSEGISFLLQSGVVPPPLTAYQNIFIVGIGDTAIINTSNNEITIDFSHEFPFTAEKREKLEDYDEPQYDDILQLLADETVKKLDLTKKTYLFHSAGKDSNSIALALAEAGLQDKITLVTHRSKGNLDESIISENIAKKLGFSHRTLHEVDTLTEDDLKYINDYFKKAPFPCVDNLCLAYPLYAKQIPELFDSNIIFGDGNDSYMISPPSTKDPLYTKISEYTSHFSFLRNYVNSENLLGPFLRTPSEWFGTSGFTLKDSAKIFPKSASVYSYWKKESKLRKDLDLFYFKSDIYSTRVITEKMIRKLFNFSDYLGSNIVLPFATQKVAEYFATYPEEYLFDRSKYKNKIILRSLLKEKLSLDSDEIGKMGWSYDTRTLILNNWELLLNEISVCSLWNWKETEQVIYRLRKSIIAKGKYSEFSCRLVYRLFLLSMWKNKSKYLND